MEILQSHTKSSVCPLVHQMQYTYDVLPHSTLCYCNCFFAEGFNWDLFHMSCMFEPLQWRHNESDGVSNHQPHDCLLKRFFRHRSKKTSKLRVTGRCEGNSPVTGAFPAQRASDAENVSIWWRHHECDHVWLLKLHHVFLFYIITWFAVHCLSSVHCTQCIVQYNAL